MVKKRGKKFIRLFNIVLLLGGLTLAVIVFPSSQSSRKTASTDYTDFLFSGTTPLTVDIIVDEADWEEMLENAQQEAYIPCEVIINGKSVRWVGIRPKGNSSLNMVLSDEESDRFSFKIEFDQYIEGQTFLGLDKLALNNVLGDATYMKEYLSYALMKEMGVPTPLFQYADIRVNGEPWGFYLAVETLEDAFLDRVYGEDHGFLYKPETTGGFGGNIKKEQNPGEAPVGFDRKLGGSTNNGANLAYIDDSPESYQAIFENAVGRITESDQRRLIQALKNVSEGADLGASVNLEETLAYFAVNTALVNLDSYQSNMCHNYYLYEEAGMISILPWDYNLSFAGFEVNDAKAAVNFPIDTPVSGVSLSERPLLAKLLSDPDCFEIYHDYLDKIAEYFKSGRFAESIDTLDTRIGDYVKNDPSAFYTYEAYTTAVTMLKRYGLYRAQSIRGQLSGTIPATTETQAANPDALLNPTGLDLRTMGTNRIGGGSGMNPDQGPGAGFGGGLPQERSGSRPFPGNPPPFGNPGFPDPQGGLMIDAETMQKAQSLLRSQNGEITESVRLRLVELGITDEQIALLSAFAGGRTDRPTMNATETGQMPFGPSERSASESTAFSLWQPALVVSYAGLGCLVLSSVVLKRVRRRKPTPLI